MAITAWPFESQDTTETQYQQVFDPIMASGVINTGEDALSVYADSTGMQIKVKAGSAWVRGVVAASDAEETLPIPAASSAARTDLVVMRVDSTTDSATLAVLQGTSATAPMPTKTASVYEVPLATVKVAAGAVTIAAGDITRVREYAGQVKDAATVGGYEIIVSSSTPSGTPAKNRIWIKPV